MVTVPRDRVRALVNVVNLSTPAGLTLARAAAEPARRTRSQLWLAPGYRWPVPRAGAFTVGNVVLLREPEQRAGGGSGVDGRLLAHEERHASQYAWCGGMLMLVGYAGAAAWSWLRTGDAASRNVFERRAGLADGGYVERPVRSWQTRRRR